MKNKIILPKEETIVSFEHVKQLEQKIALLEQVIDNQDLCIRHQKKSIECCKEIIRILEGKEQ